MFLNAVFALQKSLGYLIFFKAVLKLGHRTWIWISTALHVLGCAQRPCDQEPLTIRRENPSGVLVSAAGKNTM